MLSIYRQEKSRGVEAEAEHLHAARQNRVALQNTNGENTAEKKFLC